MRAWVNAARSATSPEQNRQRACVFCGQLGSAASEITTVGIGDILGFKRLVDGSRGEWDGYYAHVPERHFHYSSDYPGLNGAPLCLFDLHRQKIPPQCLANGLWTGAVEVPELAGLTFIEEKLIARVHVSIQMVKCRLFHRWRVDGFHPQPKVRGHITSYPVDPQTAVDRLPLAADKVGDVVKIIFVSRKSVRFADVCGLRFFIVRRRRVEAALQWLIRFNPLYKGVAIDYLALNALPDEGMIPQMFDQSASSMRTDHDDASHSRYDRPDASQPGPEFDSSSERNDDDLAGHTMDVEEDSHRVSQSGESLGTAFPLI
jgi:hypothetical protein